MKPSKEANKFAMMMKNFHGLREFQVFKEIASKMKNVQSAKVLWKYYRKIKNIFLSKWPWVGWFKFFSTHLISFHSQNINATQHMRQKNAKREKWNICSRGKGEKKLKNIHAGGTINSRCRRRRISGWCCCCCANVVERWSEWEKFPLSSFSFFVYFISFLPPTHTLNLWNSLDSYINLKRIFRVIFSPTTYHWLFKELRADENGFSGDDDYAEVLDLWPALSS